MNQPSSRVAALALSMHKAVADCAGAAPGAPSMVTGRELLQALAAYAGEILATAPPHLRENAADQLRDVALQYAAERAANPGGAFIALRPANGGPVN